MGQQPDRKGQLMVTAVFRALTADEREELVALLLADAANQTIEDDDADESLDDCAACDAPLTKCRPDAGCCDDCTHAANWPPSNRAAEGSFSGCAVCGAVAVEDAGDHADQTGHWPTANHEVRGGE